MRKLNLPKQLLPRNNWPIRLFLVHIAYLLVQNVFHFVQTRPLFDFTINLCFAVALLFVSIKNLKWRKNKIDKGFIFFHHIFFIYALIIWLISIINAEYSCNRIKVVSQLGGWLLAYSVYAYQTKNFFFSLINVIFKIWLPLIIVLLVIRYWGYTKFDNQELYLIQFIFLFLPFLNYKKRILIYLGISILMFITFDTRAMRVLLVCSLLSFFGYKMGLSKTTYRFIANSCLILPLVFISLAIVADYNIISEVSSEIDEGDTRSFIYKEVNTHIEKYNAYFWGTPGIGYDTTLADVIHKDMDSGELVSYYDDLKFGRMGSEVGILNIYQHGGLSFCILLFLLYVYTVNMALSVSNNYFCRYIVILLSFRFSFMFIDGIITNFGQSLVLWLFYSICSNKLLLKMTDQEIRNYFTTPKLMLR